MGGVSLLSTCSVGAAVLQVHCGAERTAKGPQGARCELQGEIQGTTCTPAGGQGATAAQDCGSKNSKQDVFSSTTEREK